MEADYNESGIEVEDDRSKYINNTQGSDNNSTQLDEGPNIVDNDKSSMYQSNSDDEENDEGQLLWSPCHHNNESIGSYHTNIPKNMMMLLNIPYWAMNLDPLPQQQWDQEPTVNNFIMLTIEKFNEV